MLTRAEAKAVLGPLASMLPLMSAERVNVLRSELNERERQALDVLLGVVAAAEPQADRLPPALEPREDEQLRQMWLAMRRDADHPPTAVRSRAPRAESGGNSFRPMSPDVVRPKRREVLRPERAGHSPVGCFSPLAAEWGCFWFALGVCICVLLWSVYG